MDGYGGGRVGVGRGRWILSAGTQGGSSAAVVNGRVRYI